MRRSIACSGHRYGVHARTTLRMRRRRTGAPARAGRGPGQGRPQRRSDGDAGATLRAARRQDLAATDGAHAGAKTVDAGAVDLGGLVRAFHGTLGLRKSGFKKALNYSTFRGVLSMSTLRSRNIGVRREHLLSRRIVAARIHD